MSRIVVGVMDRESEVGRWSLFFMADEAAAAEARKKRSFRKFSYRGIDLEQLLDLSTEQLVDLVHSRARRRFQRGLKRKPMGLIKKLRKVPPLTVGQEGRPAQREARLRQDPSAQHDCRARDDWQHHCHLVHSE